MIMVQGLCLLAGFAAAEFPVAGRVLEARGNPVGGAEVALSAGLSREGTVTILAQAKSDDEGRFTLIHQGGAPSGEIGTLGTIWTYKPGLGLGLVDLLRHDQPNRIHRLVVESPATRKITIQDSNGRPVVGARVTPRLVQTENSRYQGLPIPDAWLDRLAATTDARGVASLPSLTRFIDLRTILVDIKGVARHALPLPYSKGKDDVTLSLGPPARLAGRIEAREAQAGAETSIEVWSRLALPAPNSRDVLSTPERVLIEGTPIAVKADGSFESPAVLMAGTTYRVVIRRQGCAPALSDWIKLGKSPVAPVSIPLQPLVKIEGRVIDRRGKPVASASVSQAGSGPETATDSAGRFVLVNAHPGPSFLIARKDGFRLQGLEAGANSLPVALVLSRTAEPPESKMATLPPPLSLDESRALARRLLEPILKEARAKGDDAAKLWLLRVERWLDPADLLEQVEKTSFARSTTADYLKGEAALALVASDPEEAVAVAESIVDPAYKAGTLVDLVDALPPSELARKLTLLDRAAAQARTAAQGSNKLFQMGEVAERWLELGEKDKALALFGDGRTLVDALPPAKRTDAGSFLAHLARVDAKAPLELISGVGTDRWNQRIVANIAIRSALGHPASAEQALMLLHEPMWRQEASLRVCRRLASLDPVRARQIASRLPRARERAYAWTFLADGLVGTDPAGARAALDQAFRELDDDRARVPSVYWDPSPAASILPLCERIAADRVPEVFWRAVAEQPPGDDPRDEFGLDHNLIDGALLLSRYDRSVAAALFAPAAAFTRSLPLRGGNDLTPAAILAMGCLDPRGAVQFVEGLPKARSLDVSDPTNWARQTLALHLAMPPDRRWLAIWRFHSGCGISMFEDVYRDL
jgi:hypothetical protein